MPAIHDSEVALSFCLDAIQAIRRAIYLASLIYGHPSLSFTTDYQPLSSTG